MRTGQGIAKRSGRRRRGIGWASGLLVGGLLLGFVGCGPPVENVLVDQDGNSIRLVQIFEVLTNENLTTEEQRQSLRDLGITDDSLIDLLIETGG